MNDDYEQDEILSILTDAHKNHVSHHLLPPKQMRGKIDFISNRLKNKFLVPEGNNL